MLKPLTLAFILFAANVAAQTSDGPAVFEGETLTPDGQVSEVVLNAGDTILYGLTIPETAIGMGNIHVKNSHFNLYETKALELRFRVSGAEFADILAAAQADAEAAGFVPGGPEGYSDHNEDDIGRYAFTAETPQGEARYYYRYQSAPRGAYDIVMSIATPFKVDPE